MQKPTSGGSGFGANQQIGTKVQADAVKDRKENADTEEKTAAMQSVISSQDAQLQKLRQSVYTRSSTAQ
ncbi:hypothetical protein SAMD00023378_0298 [Ralstonia sp. NT80]|nr:hypothetical protein SAMD00023378_0298 [Ralstonia sp. NT80]